MCRASEEEGESASSFRYEQYIVFFNPYVKYTWIACARRRGLNAIAGYEPTEVSLPRIPRERLTSGRLPLPDKFRPRLQ